MPVAKDSTVREVEVNRDIPDPKTYGSSPRHSLSKESHKGASPRVRLG